FPGGEGPECRAIARSLADSFPYIKVYRSSTGEGFHFLASMRPLNAPAVERLIPRIPPAAKKDFLEWETGDLQSVLARILAQEVPIGSLLAEDRRVRITDD